MLTLKKTGGTTGDRGTTRKEPQKKPKRNILRTHVKRFEIGRCYGMEMNVEKTK